ncbi:MAG: hypothetical protein ACPHSD_03690 [Candidatus Latescibacterota bacterium]
MRTYRRIVPAVLALAVSTADEVYAQPTDILNGGPASASGDPGITDLTEPVIYRLQLQGGGGSQRVVQFNDVELTANAGVIASLNLYYDNGDPGNLYGGGGTLMAQILNPALGVDLSIAPGAPVNITGSDRWFFLTLTFNNPLASNETVLLEADIDIDVCQQGGGGAGCPAPVYDPCLNPNTSPCTDMNLAAQAVFTVNATGGGGGGGGGGGSGGGGGGNSGGGGGGGSSGVVFDLAAARADSDSTVSSFGTVTEVPFGGEWIFALIAFSCGLFYLYTRQSS